MLRLGATLPASLPALASFPEADASFTAHAFILAGRYVTSPMTSHQSNEHIICVFRAGHAEGVPKTSPDTAFLVGFFHMEQVRSPITKMTTLT